MTIYKPWIGRAVRLFFLLALLLCAFFLYSLVRIRETASVRFSPTTEVQEMPLYKHVARLSVAIGSRSIFEYDKLMAAKEYILACLKAMGYRPALQDYSYQGRIFSNITASLPGKTHPEEVVVIGAHFDTVIGSPGADDNASGVATLLEMCRLLKNAAPERTLEMVFFTLEEPPLFRSEYMGSLVYARAAKKEKKKIIAMLSLEMLGYYSDQHGKQSFPAPLMNLLYPSTPNFIAVVGDLSSRSLAQRVTSSLRQKQGIMVESLSTFSFLPGIDFSDHRSFWKMGYPAVMITDTAFYRNPNYHTEEDKPETLDFPRMSRLLEALVATAQDLTNSAPRKVP